MVTDLSVSSKNPRIQQFLLLLSNVTSRPADCSPSVPNRVPTKQVKQPGQEREVSNCVSIWSGTSLLSIHGPTAADPPAVLQHLAALSASPAAQPGLQGGERVQQHSPGAYLWYLLRLTCLSLCSAAQFVHRGETRPLGLQRAAALQPARHAGTSACLHTALRGVFQFLSGNVSVKKVWYPLVSSHEDILEIFMFDSCCSYTIKSHQSHVKQVSDYFFSFLHHIT